MTHVTSVAFIFSNIPKSFLFRFAVSTHLGETSRNYIWEKQPSSNQHKPHQIGRQKITRKGISECFRLKLFAQDEWEKKRKWSVAKLCQAMPSCSSGHRVARARLKDPAICHHALLPSLLCSFQGARGLKTQGPSAMPPIILYIHNMCIHIYICVCVYVCMCV